MASYWRIVRVLGAVAYGVALFIYYRAEPVAAAAYDKLCGAQGASYGDRESAGFLLITLLVLLFPLVAARSRIAVTACVALSLITLVGALGLLVTAGDTPYECFTQAGTYEDHTSGLEGFSWWVGGVVLLTWVAALVDLTIWSALKVIGRLWRRRLARGAKPAPRSG